MYVRSHIEIVSGINKYIYVNSEDDTNNKYIREKNIYYPVKKYKGVLKIVRNGKGNKIRKGGALGDIKLTIKIYEKDGNSPESKQITTEDINITKNEVIPYLASHSSSIMPEQDIHIFNKSINTQNILAKLAGSGDQPDYGINHFIIIKESDGRFNVYIRIQLNEPSESQDIVAVKKYIHESLKDCYHIIYKRNNKITKSSSATDNIIVIFSILNKGVDTINIQQLEKSNKYEKYEDDKMYVALYTKLIDELTKLFQP
jgi:hypothetical protein